MAALQDFRQFICNLFWLLTLHFAKKSSASWGSKKSVVSELIVRRLRTRSPWPTDGLILYNRQVIGRCQVPVRYLFNKHLPRLKPFATGRFLRLELGVTLRVHFSCYQRYVVFLPEKRRFTTRETSFLHQKHAVSWPQICHFVTLNMPFRGHKYAISLKKRINTNLIILRNKYHRLRKKMPISCYY